MKDYIKIFIVGFPCDLGASNCGARTGSENGPNNFREIMELKKNATDNEEYKVNLSKTNLKVFDCGNIKFETLNL